jgi:hypothetical protein
MSLYNALFGVNQSAPFLLRTLGLNVSDAGRFRDCYISGDKIVLYTRNGGGNREDYQHVFDSLSKHPNYITDYDDDFDCTYASIEFSFPDEYKDDLTALSQKSESHKPSEKWLNLLNSISGETK